MKIIYPENGSIWMYQGSISNRIRARDGAGHPVDVRYARTGAEAKKLESSSPAGLDLSKKGHLNDVLFLIKESARRDSNPRPRPWQGRAPPTEPLAHI